VFDGLGCDLSFVDIPPRSDVPGPFESAADHWAGATENVRGDRRSRVATDPHPSAPIERCYRGLFVWCGAGVDVAVAGCR